jgi:ABC-type transport system involved in multi-copper enzyme maturation permease subunit
VSTPPSGHDQRRRGEAIDVPTAPAGPTPASPPLRPSAPSLPRSLAALNPIPALLGPIFQKEVRSAGRRRSTYALRSGYVLALLAIVALAFAGGRTGGHRTAVQRIQELQMLAPTLTGVAMWFQFIAMALVAPLLAAPAICDERRARSLATLLTTPLHPREIILGKLSSRVVQLVILSLLVAPVLLAIRVFGGLDASIVIAFTCVSLTLGVLGASLGVLYSIWHRRATAAALFAMLSLVLLQGGPSAVEALRVYLVTDVLGISETAAFTEQIAATASPYTLAWLHWSIVSGAEVAWFTIRSERLYSLLGGLTDPQGAGAPITVPIAPVWVVSSLYNLLMAGIILELANLALRGSMRREAGETPTAPSPRRRRRADAADSGAQAPADEPHRQRARLRTVSDRPVLWRELRRSAIAGRRLRIAVIVSALAGLVLLYGLAGIYNEGMQIVMAVVGSLIVTCQVVFMTTGGISSEREGRTWDVLLTTPLTAREIILGKYLGALRGQWFLPGIIVAHFVISAITGAVPWFFVAQFLVIILGPILCFTATGQFFSLALRKGITGAVLNLMLALTLWIGLWLFLILYAWVADTGGESFQPLWQALYAINPIMMAGSACDPVARGMASSRWTFTTLRYDMLDTSVGFSAFNQWLAGAFAFYLAAGAGALTLTIALFRGFSGRSS